MKDAETQVLSPYRWVIVAVSMLAGFIGSYAQFQLPPLAYKLMPALDISASEFAALMGGPLTGSLFICLISGTLADRYGVKNVVTVGLILSVIGCTFRYAATSGSSSDRTGRHRFRTAGNQSGEALRRMVSSSRWVP